MNPPISKIPTHPRDKNINFLLLPPQPSRQQCQTKPFQPVENIRLVPLPQHLHERILRPPIGRPHKHPLPDVDKSRICHPREIVVGAIASHGTAESARGFAEEFAPLHQVGVRGCAVRGLNGEAIVLEFEPAAGFEVAAE